MSDGGDDDFVRIAQQVHAVRPEEFTAERTRRSAAARSAGDRALAAEIAALRKPTLSAWAVNQLVAVHRSEVEELVELGRGLRERAAGPTGVQLKAFSEQRSRKVRELVATAQSRAEASDVRLSRQALVEIEQTLRAGLADESAAAEILSGRLERPLQYAGLGFTGDVAPWVQPSTVSRSAPATTSTAAAVQARDTRGNQQRLTAAREAVTGARRADAAATHAAEAAAEVLAAAQLRVAIAQRELQAAEDAEAEAEATSDAAAQRQALAHDGLVAAERALAQLEE